MTLVEIMIVASLSVVIAAILVSFLFFVTRICKSTFSQMKFTDFARRSIERTARIVRYAKRIEVRDGGDVLLCYDENDTTHTIYYSDDDDTTWTLCNNRLYYDRPGFSQPIVIGCYITPLPGKPIFEYQDRTTAVEVNFRVGDPNDDPGAQFHAETGPGPQGLTVQTAFGPRNSYLE